MGGSALFSAYNRPQRTWIVGICIMLAAWAPRLAAQWRIMPIGDSITEGVGSSAGTGFRPYLYNKLQGIDFTMVGPNGASPCSPVSRGVRV